MDRGSAARARLVARAPRAAAFAAVGALSLLGARALIADPPAPPPAAAAPGPEASATGHAEAFARAYLGWREGRHHEREDALAALGAEPGLSPPPRGTQRVRWSAALAERAGPRGTRVVTVAAETGDGRLWHLAVPVALAGGRAAIAGPPALVGAPPRAEPGRAPGGPEVADPALAAAARRAIANYLAADRENLLADLAPGALVSLPGAPIEGRPGAVTWSDRAGGWATIAVSAELPGGARAELAYDLSVVNEGRWLVRAIAPATAP